MTNIEFWQEYQKLCRTFNRRCSLCPLNNKCNFNLLHDMKPIDEEMVSDISETIQLPRSGISMTIEFTIKTSPFIRGMIECNDNVIEDTFENFFYAAIPFLQEHNIFVIPEILTTVWEPVIERDNINGVSEVEFDFLHKDATQQAAAVIEDIISKRLLEDGVETEIETKIRE